jgi:rubrerythrin
LRFNGELKMGRTNENLKDAFAGESQANRRYLAFAQKAEKDGLVQAAKLLGEIKSTTDNLDAAVSGETFEFKKMYPKYLRLAKQEGNHQAAWSFDVANKVEQVHANLLSKAVEALRNDRELAKIDYYICSVCGNTVEGTAPEKCPICGAPKTKFFKVA